MLSSRVGSRFNHLLNMAEALASSPCRLLSKRFFAFKFQSQRLQSSQEALGSIPTHT